YRMGTQNGFDVFSGVVAIDAKSQQSGYDFQLTDGTAKLLYNQTATLSPTQGAPQTPGFSVPPPQAETPEWARHAVWYQIFPERFRNGDASNDPTDHDYEHLVKWTSDWWKDQPGEEPSQPNN